MITKGRSSVDIIIPCYNMSKYLPAAIESALEQDYEPLHVIVVDDGSTEDIAGIVQKYPKGVTYLRQENRGLPAARNTGIKHSESEYICFLDADDIILPSKTARQAVYLDENPSVDVVYGQAFLFNDLALVYPFADLRPAVQWSDYLDPLCILCPFPIHSALIRRSTMNRIGMFEETMRTGCEDWALWLNYALRGAVFRFLPGLTALYRKHADSMSTQLPRLLSNESKWLPVLAKKFEEEGLLSGNRATLVSCGLQLTALRYLKIGQKKDFISFRDIAERFPCPQKRASLRNDSNAPISYLLLSADICDLGLPQLAFFCLLDFGDLRLVRTEAEKRGLTDLFDDVIECIKRPYTGTMHQNDRDHKLVPVESFQRGPTGFHGLEKQIPREISHTAYLFRQLGHLAREAGKLDDACMQYRRALELNPYCWVWYEDLVRVLDATDRRSEAEVLISNVMNVNHEFRFGHYCLGKFSVRKGKIADGARYFMEVIAADPRLVLRCMRADILGGW